MKNLPSPPFVCFFLESLAPLLQLHLLSFEKLNLKLDQQRLRRPNTPGCLTCGLGYSGARYHAELPPTHGRVDDEERGQVHYTSRAVQCGSPLLLQLVPGRFAAFGRSFPIRAACLRRASSLAYITPSVHAAKQMKSLTAAFTRPILSLWTDFKSASGRRGAGRPLGHRHSRSRQSNLWF